MAEGELKFHLEGVLSAPPERVFSLLSDPGELSKWWGPHGFTIPEIDLDLRVGGGYRIAMQPPEGDVFHLNGEFREVDPPKRLAYTFVWDPPAPDDQETIVTLSLHDRGDSTDLHLDQGPFKTEERLELHRSGWSDGFEKLRDLTS